MTDLERYADPGTALDTAHDPAGLVLGLCEQGLAALARALTYTDLEDVVNVKAWAGTLEAATRQKHLGHEAGLAAAELVRRAEWRMSQLVRQGQAAGAIRDAMAGRAGHREAMSSLPGALDYFRSDEERTDAFTMADADPDLVEVALAEGKEEGNLSRANIVRKLKGEDKRPELRGEWHHKRRRIDPARVVNESVSTLAGIVDGLRLIDLDDLTGVEEWWLDSLDAGIRQLSKLRAHLRSIEAR